MTVDQLSFTLEFVRNLREVGAVLPSSRFLGRASAAHVPPAATRIHPIRVLEAGAGTGSFTCEIIPRLGADDALDVFELNPAFCAMLQTRLQRNGLLDGTSAQINLINGDLLTFPLDTRYDNIVSSLPLSNLPVEFVERFLAQMMARLKPGGIFSYVQYAALGRLKYTFGDATTRASMTKKALLIEQYAGCYQVACPLVWRNVPPTWVYYWQKPVDEAGRIVDRGQILPGMTENS